MLEIKLFVVAGSFPGCVFVPQVYLHHELRCVCVAIGGREKTDGFAVRLCCSRACESAVNVIRVFTNAATVIQDLIPIVLRLNRHVEVVGMSSFGHSMAGSAGDNVIDPDEKKRFPVPGQIYGSAETHAG